MANGQPTTGLGGGLQGLLRFLASERDRRERETERTTATSQQEADRALRERQIAAAEAQTAHERGMAIGGALSPGAEVEPAVLEQLGTLAGVFTEPGTLVEDQPGPQLPVGRTPYRAPSTVRVPGLGVIDVDPAAGTSQTLVEEPETFETETGLGEEGAGRELVQIGSRGTVRRTGVGAPTPPSIDTALIQQQTRAMSDRNRQTLAQTNNEARAAIAQMVQGGAGNRAALSAYVQLVREQLRSTIAQATLQMNVERNLPEGWIGGGPGEDLQGLLEDSMRTLDALDQLAPQQGAGGLLTAPGVLGGDLPSPSAGEAAPSDGPAPSPDAAERARELIDRYYRPSAE